MLPRDGASLAALVLQGDRRAVARAITWAESRDPRARALLAEIYPRTGRAQVLGVTGPPGGGKSTLVDRLVDAHRKAGRKVGVVAIDPSSPFTGGALLGDRVRMEKRSTDTDVFIRSMATRGHLGGLSRAAADAVRILDASGKDVVIVETVGVGQSEVDVVRVADTVLVIAVPGMGDEIQSIKAGLMEIGDLFVVNKADREGADRTVAELEAWLEHTPGGWAPPVLQTVASTGQGVEAVMEAVERHRRHVHDQGLLHARRRAQAEHEVVEVLRERSAASARAHPSWRKLVDEVAQRRLDPYAAADAVAGGADPRSNGDAPR